MKNNIHSGVYATFIQMNNIFDIRAQLESLHESQAGLGISPWKGAHWLQWAFDQYLEEYKAHGTCRQ